MWKPIQGYEDEYLISDRGEVWSIRGNRILQPKREKTGYLRITLSTPTSRKTFAVHRLVALAFIPNPENKPTVNHLNEIKNDNRVENLSWATHREQNVHGTRIARAMANTNWVARSTRVDYYAIARKHNYETMNAKQMRKVAQLNPTGEIITTYDSIGQAARSIGVSSGRIWECCNGRRKTCKGSIWNYV